MFKNKLNIILGISGIAPEFNVLLTNERSCDFSNEIRFLAKSGEASISLL